MRQKIYKNQPFTVIQSIREWRYLY